MKSEFTNRLGMFNTALTTLNLAKHKPAWFNQPPAVFTVKVAAATDAEAAAYDLTPA